MHTLVGVKNEELDSTSFGWLSGRDWIKAAWLIR